MKIFLLSFLLLLVGCINPVSVDTDDVALYGEAREAYDADEYDKAISTFKEIVDDYPWSSKVDNSLEYWGKALLKQATKSDDTELYDSAYSTFGRIPVKSSGYVEAYYYQGLSLQGNFEADGAVTRDSVVTTLVTIHSKWPKNEYAEKAVRVVVDLFLEEEMEDSAKYYAKMIGFEIGDTLSDIEKEQYGAARSLYITATKSDAKEDYDTAISALKDYISSATNDSLKAEAIMYVGKSYYRSDRYSESTTWFEQVLDSDASDATIEESLYRVAYAYYKTSNTEKAKEYFKQYTEDYSEGEYLLSSLSYLGKIAEDTGDEAGALKWYREVISQDVKGSEDRAALFSVGEISYGQNEFDSTVTLLSRYLSRYPFDDLQDAANSYRLIGHAHRKNNRLDDALESFESVVNEERYHETNYYDNTLYWAGRVSYDLGDKDQAKEYLEEYLELFPTGNYSTNAEATLQKIGA